MEKKNKLGVRTIIQMLVYLVLIPMLPLILSGRWNWWEAWFYALSCFNQFCGQPHYRCPQIPRSAGRARQISEARETPSPGTGYWRPLVGLGGNVIPLTVGMEARYGQVFDFGLPLELIAMLFILVWFCLGILRANHQPLLFRYGAPADRPRTSGGVRRPIPLHAPPGVRRRHTDIYCHSPFPGFGLGFFAGCAFYGCGCGAHTPGR